jgi:hypothetical protein
MEDNAQTTQQKALRINLDPVKYGTFAEIGAGQEVVRWFFQVGRSSATVAKSMSAYDTVVSDDIYGSTSHYVSRQRLSAMLDHEYALLRERLEKKRGAQSTFFVFADTVATGSMHRGNRRGHGWLGIRFQTEPGSATSEILLHAQLLDNFAGGQQEALGILGVNLIHGAFYHHEAPVQLIGLLLDGLRRGRVEVDLIKFSGPAFQSVDHRLMSLQLVEQGLTSVAMFTSEGEVVQPSEVLSGKPVLIERGSFRPVTNLTAEMLDCALAQTRSDATMQGGDAVVLMEMTLCNLMDGDSADHKDFLARVDTLSTLGKLVMISNYTRFDYVTGYLRSYTGNWIVMPIGLPTLREILDEKYYAEVQGGILAGLGLLFQGNVKLYVHPMRTEESGEIHSLDHLKLDPPLQHLYGYLRASRRIEQMKALHQEQLHIYPGDVLAKMQAGDPSWESMVPAAAVEMIKRRKLFGVVSTN